MASSAIAAPAAAAVPVATIGQSQTGLSYPTGGTPFSITSAPANQSTTTISNYNKINKTIPDNTSTLTNLSTKGSNIDANGNTVAPDGTVTPPVVANHTNGLPAAGTPASNGGYGPGNAAPSTIVFGPDNQVDANGNPITSTGTDQNGNPLAGDTTDATINTMLDTLKSNTDANTSSQISNIQQTFAAREAQQALINKSQLAARRGALLMGGMGGSFSSAPFAAGSIVASQESVGIQTLANLDAQENTAIQAAKTAQDNRDYQLVDAKIKEAQTVRAQKVALAESLNKSAQAANTKLLESQQQAQKDTSIADLIANGTDNPNQILSTLNTDSSGNSTGAGVTAADVTRVLGNIAKQYGLDTTGLSGNIKNFYALKATNRLPTNITSLPEEQQMPAFLASIAKKTGASTTDPAMGADLSGAESAIANGGDPATVRQLFLQTYPKAAAQFDAYFKKLAGGKGLSFPSGATASSSAASASTLSYTQ